MQRIWVQLCGKNRYKVTILIMDMRMRGNWVFIDMINGGVACLADDTRVLTVVFFFGGDHRLGGTVTGTNINKRGQQIKYNAQAHDVVVHDVMVLFVAHSI